MDLDNLIRGDALLNAPSLQPGGAVEGLTLFSQKTAKRGRLSAALPTSLKTKPQAPAMPQTPIAASFFDFWRDDEGRRALASCAVAMRARGGRGAMVQSRRKKRCDRGAACPFKNENQHASEYHHDEPPAKGGQEPAKRRKKADKWGAGHVLDPQVVAAAGEGEKRCTYCKKPGHNITKCDAPGADAELRRRAARRQAKEEKKALSIGEAVGTVAAPGGAALVARAPQPMKRERNQPPPLPPAPVAVAAPLKNALPEEYLSRMAVRSEPAGVRGAMRSAQDAAYEEAIREDERKREEERARQKEEEFERLLQLSLIEAEEAQRVKKKQRRAELDASEPVANATDSVVLQFNLPSGARVRRAFRASDLLHEAVAEWLSLREELENHHWAAALLAVKDPLIECDRSGRIVSARRASVGEIGRVAIFVTLQDE